MPSTIPATSASRVTPAATVRLTLMPTKTRTAMSRPSTSVPKMWPSLSGGRWMSWKSWVT